jgi:hypothetical protein
MTDSPYRWVIVGAGGLMGCVAMGSLFSLPVLLTPMADATGWSRTPNRHRMATGPVLGGWIFDTTGGYGALYVTSFGLGLGAFLIAMTFRPFPKASVAARPQAA